MIHQTGFRIGQVLPPAVLPPRALFVPGEERWHALMVMPQTENRVGEDLAAAGAYAFHPVEHRTRRVRGIEVTRTSRYLPGYVFARFPGEPIWHRIFRDPRTSERRVRDVVRSASGAPARLHPDDLHALHAMRDVDRDARRRAAEAAMLKVGDAVKVALFGDEACEVVTIKGGTATIRMRILGGERDVAVTLASLTRA